MNRNCNKVAFRRFSQCVTIEPIRWTFCASAGYLQKKQQPYERKAIPCIDSMSGNARQSKIYVSLVNATCIWMGSCVPYILCKLKRNKTTKTTTGKTHCKNIFFSLALVLYTEYWKVCFFLEVENARALVWLVREKLQTNFSKIFSNK